ncbi:hypothetical protein XBFFL1_1100004 [Xenorhabdus bovienii str. feltiae Florida]|nr:hypothetical protein XBFFR1_1090004 [Xenorhabdus bovienii str. feltiae France]CDG90833.1 hypothetical protein XBFFL1_1100004 [Xenorhabdus bovienii str. feltiae Florida]
MWIFHSQILILHLFMKLINKLLAMEFTLYLIGKIAVCNNFIYIKMTDGIYKKLHNLCQKCNRQ